VFPPLGIDNSFLPYVRHPTRYKKVLVYAKIDGKNWYDISDYVKEVTITNKLEFLSAPQIDTASITLANLNNEWTPTQYNDTFDPANGKFNGTVDEGYLQKEWEVRIELEVDNGSETITVPVFYGVKTSLKEEHKTARLQLKDILYYATKKKLEHDIFYINKTPTEILTDLLNRAGYSNYDFQETTYTCCFLAKKDQTIWQAIVNLMKGIGGKISTKPDGTIIFRARYDNYHEPDVAVDLAQDTFKKYDLNTERQYNKIIVNSEGYDVDDETTDVINFELQDNNIIEAGKTATFELEYISDFAVDVLDTVTLWYEGDAFSEEGVDFTPSNNYTDGTYLKITKYKRYADKVVLEIKNITESTDVKITRVKIQGTQVKKATVDKVIRENTTGEPDKEYSITSFFTKPVDEQNVPIPLKNIADILYDDINKTVHFGLSMNEFYPDVYAGNIVTFSVPRKGIASGNFLVLKVEHQLSGATFKSSLDLVEWSGLNYQVGDKTHTRSVRSPDPVQQQIQDVQSDVQELQNQVTEVNNRTSNMDGVAPSVPQNIQYATLVNDKGESVIRIWWDTNSEEDAVSYYEVQWSYDGTNWRSVTTGGTMAEFVVAGNVTVYAKVRAVDVEGLKSDWSSVLTITSAKDEVPPATPTGLSAEGLFQKVVVKWNPNTEEDFDHYVLEYDVNSDFSTAEQVITETNQFIINGEPNTTYYIHIKAVDTSGNESNWTDTVTASTEYIGALEINLQTSGYNLVINSDFTDGNGNPTDDGWKIWLGTPGEVVEVDTPATGKYAYQNAPNKVVWVYSAKPIPIQRDRAYIIEGYFRTVSGSSGRIFLAVRLLDENMNNISGDGTWWYYPASGVRPPSSFKYYYGIFGANTSRPFPNNARYIQAGFILNYDGGNSIQQVQGIRIREIIESAYIRDAAITSAKIGEGQILNAHIHDGEIDNAKIANVDASKITTGYLDADRIEAGSITFDKLAFRGTFSLPDGAVAYWTNSLIDEINQIKPKGYDEVNLSPTITLTPENAPEGSVVAGLLAGNEIYAGTGIYIEDKFAVEKKENDQDMRFFVGKDSNTYFEIDTERNRAELKNISLSLDALHDIKFTKSNVEVRDVNEIGYDGIIFDFLQTTDTYFISFFKFSDDNSVNIFLKKKVGGNNSDALFHVDDKGLLIQSTSYSSPLTITNAVLGSVTHDENYLEHLFTHTQDTFWVLLGGKAGPYNSEGCYTINLPHSYSSIYSVQLTTLNSNTGNDDAWARVVSVNNDSIVIRIEYSYHPSVAANRYVYYLVWGIW